MYFGVIFVSPTVPPVMYVSTARGDIFHPGGRSYLSAAARASISRANMTSAGARSTSAFPLPVAAAAESSSSSSAAFVFFIAMGSSLVGFVLEGQHGVHQPV